MDATQKMHVVREYLANALDWKSAHIGMDDVFGRFGPATYGVRVEPLPYSAWQLVEHMRITQRDILDFCRDPSYQEPHWPDDYWPTEAAPAGSAHWDTALQAFRQDLADMKRLVSDEGIDLLAPIPHGDGQTYLREALLVIDHNAYHLGQLVVLWRLVAR